MNKKRIIRKVLTALFWLITGTGMVVLLVAANKPDQGHVLREVRISIKGDGEQFFIDKTDILIQLAVAAKSDLQGKPLDRIRLDRLERALEKGVWIREAQLWIDSRDVLHVQVTEREPVARVFTTNGETFYIDSSGKHMPLLEKESARVLVVTNFPGAAKLTHRDSTQVADVKLWANKLVSDSFWKEQIAQIDITPSGTYEAIPVVGNHIIRLGNADQIDVKLHKLKLFYRQVLAKTGFDRYAVVDVQYAGQVVGVYRGAVSAVDSLQLQQNIDALLARSQQLMLQDSLAAVQESLQADTARSHAALPIDSIATLPEPPENAPARAADTAHHAARTAADTAARHPPPAARPVNRAPQNRPRAVSPQRPARRTTGNRNVTNEY